jgi:hypothetical protein
MTMTRPGFEPGPSRWEAGDYNSDLIHLNSKSVTFIFNHVLKRNTLPNENYVAEILGSLREGSSVQIMCPLSKLDANDFSGRFCVCLNTLVQDSSAVPFFFRPRRLLGADRDQ